MSCAVGAEGEKQWLVLSEVVDESPAKGIATGGAPHVVGRGAGLHHEFAELFRVLREIAKAQIRQHFRRQQVGLETGQIRARFRVWKCIDVTAGIGQNTGASWEFPRAEQRQDAEDCYDR